MKWRLRSDSSPRKEISDNTNTTSYDNSQSEVINGNAFSPPALSDDARRHRRPETTQTYKPRRSSAVVLDDVDMQQPAAQKSQTMHRNPPSGAPSAAHTQKRRQSLEHAYKIDNGSCCNSNSLHANDPNSSSVYIIGNEMLREPNSPAWMKGKTRAVPSSSAASIGSDETAAAGHHHHHQHHNPPPSTTQSSPGNNPSSNGSFTLKNGSTVKLLPAVEDQSSTQTKCSVFRGLVLCICLNISYANVVRFPRELDRFGSAYLIPYLVLLFLVGLPIILLEISIGQFLGQGAAHTWRSSPIFKGACIVSRFASWLASIWVSLQAVLAVVYIGMFAYKAPPFKDCIGDIKLAETGYKVLGTNGQDCIQKTFLIPLWDNPLYFGLVTLALIFLWIIIMLCTHNAKVFRRITFFFGLLGFTLLCTLTGWEVHQSLHTQYFPELWPFDQQLLLTSGIWFNALVQVIYSTNIGFGVLPVITGKFLYKGDAVRTSVVYLCFNMLINAIAVALFMVQFDNLETRASANPLEVLKPLSAVYDRVLHDPTNLLKQIVPILVFVLVVLACVISIATAVYTSSRLVPRHPNYVLSLFGLIVAVGAFVAPKFFIPSVLDTRVVGTLVVCALICDLIATMWIYGAKNVYTDLEFSIGRPIMKAWLVFWCCAPLILAGILVWWCVYDDRYDLLLEYLPRWAPIVFVLAVILIMACVEVFEQVDYNFVAMIREAAKSAKEWGPADPLARHAWKQWRSVCQDTGRKDFTLRRRGTRDYTHSIKKGQYSTATTTYGNQNWKSSSTPGSSSPNYSGSVFGDSAIEEDMSVDKYSGINTPFQTNDGKPMRYSSGRSSHQGQDNGNKDKHKEIVYIRRLSNDNGNHATRIEITPSNESITYGTKNPMGRSTSTLNRETGRPPPTLPAGHPPNEQSHQSNGSNGGQTDHICWRKFNVNPEEYSTEL